MSLAINCGDASSNLTDLNLQFQTGTGPLVTSYLSQTSIVCESGFFWPDGDSNKALICSPSAKWSNLIICTCKIFLFLLYELNSAINILYYLSE